MTCLGGILGTYGPWESISRKIKHLKENEDVGQAISYKNEMTLITACINSESPALYPAFVLSIDAGRRASELKRLRLHDLLEDDTPEVIVHKSKTDAGERVIPLTARSVAALRKWLRRFPDAGPDSYVFPRHAVEEVRGTGMVMLTKVALDKPIQSWQHAWATALKRAKLQFRWHNLRHTFITRLAENPDVSEQTILALAGHVSKKMLERYSHIRKKAKRNAIDTLEAINALEREQVSSSQRGGGTKRGTIFAREQNEGSQLVEKIWLP